MPISKKKETKKTTWAENSLMEQRFNQKIKTHFGAHPNSNYGTEIEFFSHQVFK